MPNYDLEMAESVIAARELEIDRLLCEVSNLKLAGEEARKVIDSLNAKIPREPCDSVLDRPAQKEQK